MMESSWVSLITVLAYRMPILVVWLIGAFLAIARWQRHPRVSIVVLCACAVSTGAMLFQFVGQVFLVRMLDMDHVGHVLMFMGAVSSAVHAVAIGLLVFAAFVDRSTATSPRPTKLPPIRDGAESPPVAKPFT